MQNRRRPPRTVRGTRRSPGGRPATPAAREVSARGPASPCRRPRLRRTGSPSVSSPRLGSPSPRGPKSTTSCPPASVFLLSFPLLSAPGKKKKIGRRGRYKDKLSLSRGEEAGFTHNFKLSHIPVYPLQLSCRKSFWMGNYFSCAWLTQKGERACSSHELPKKKKKYSGLLGCLLGSLPAQCPNIYTYQFHTKDHHIVHSSRKQLSISLGV